MNKYLREQVDRILGEDPSKKHSVIVQMSREEMSPIIRVAGKLAHERRLCTSARELLPAHAETLKTRTVARSRALRAAKHSLSSQLALGDVKRRKKQAMVSAARQTLRPFLRSELARRSFEKMASRNKYKKAQEPVWFWSSASAVLEIDTDDLAKLPDMEGIAAVYPNRTRSVPPYTKVRSLPANVADNKTSAWGLHAIGALATWGAYGADGEGVTIGVLDTGVDDSHPDLQGKVDEWAEFDDQGQQVPGSTAHDSHGHGTHVAGTLVGGEASERYIGVAPGARLAVGLVLQGGSGTDAQILAGMEWAIDAGVDVISMSLGGLSFDEDVPDTYTQTILSAASMGIPVVAAIGNDGHQTSGLPSTDFFAYAVGATDVDDKVAGFSGGRTQVIWDTPFINPQFLPLVYSKPDVSAPGEAVYSSVMGGGWEAWNGTSMATPHVAGAIGLLLSATSIRDQVDSSQRAFLLHDLMTASVEELGESGQDHRYGWGRIDVLRAVGFAWEQGYGL